MKTPRSLNTVTFLAALLLLTASIAWPSVNAQNPGISENKIIIGSVIPASGPLAEMGAAIKAVTTAYFAEVNAQGGLYGRRIEIKFAETGATPAATRDNVDRLVKDEQVFAMSGPFIAGADKEFTALVAQNKVPVVGPFTLFPQTSVPLNQQIFYLLGGMDEQVRAAINFIAGKPELKSSHIAVIHPSGGINAGVFEAIADQQKRAGLNQARNYDYQAGEFDVAGTIKLREAKIDLVFFMGNTEELLSFLSEADKLGFFPRIFLPGGSAGRRIYDAPVGFDGKVFYTFSTSPADQTPEGSAEFRSFAEKYKLPSHHVAAQISAYSAAKILVEALRRAGKDVTRERLIQALEGFSNYSTGLSPAVTYGPNRRIGSRGSYMVGVDLKNKQLVPVSGWIEVEK